MEKELLEKLTKKIEQGSESNKRFYELLKQINDLPKQFIPVIDLIRKAEENQIPTDQFFSSKDGENALYIYNGYQVAFRVIDKEHRKGYTYWYVDENGNLFRSNYSYDYSNHKFSDTFQIYNPPKDIDMLNERICNMDMIIKSYARFEKHLASYLEEC